MTKTAKTLADFQAAHDPDVKIPTKMRAGIASLRAEGKEAWEYELDFCKRCDIGGGVIGKYREQFIEHIVLVRPGRSGTLKNVWFGDVAVAKKARG